MAHGRERAFDDVSRAQMLPVLGREVVEGEQRIAILDQALDRLVLFDAYGFDEGIERGECILLGLGHPDLLQRPPGFRLLALRQLVQDIASQQRCPCVCRRAASGRRAAPSRIAHSRARPTSSFLPSGVAPMMTNRHYPASSSLACTWMPSTRK